MSRWLKTLPLGLALATLSIVMTGCNSSNRTQARFVHAIQNEGSLDITVNGTKTFKDVPFTGFQPSSGYTDVPVGTDTIEGFVTGTSTQVFTVSGIRFGGGIEYTVIATGFATSTTSAVIVSTPDNDTEPPAGTIKFRVINASPSSPGPLDIYIQQSQVQGLTPPATITSLAYQQPSKYIPEPYNTNGGGYTIYVCMAGSTIPIFQQNIPVGGSNVGSIRTLILTDQPGIDQLNPQFIVLNDLN